MATNDADLPEEDEPLDAELIAYLDGELDDADARAVEDRLARDSQLRHKAEAYKKTFDLLDYLPKPEPSPDFATRTLTRLQPALPVPKVSESGQPVPNFPLSASNLSQLSGTTPTIPGGRWMVRLLFAAAVFLAGLGGYYGHAMLRPYLVPVKSLSLEDVAIIEHLPLYLAVDDIHFVKALDHPDLFALEPTPATFEFVRPEVSPATREKLTELFKDFPSERQEELRELHQKLYRLPSEQRNHLLRVLEHFSVWFDRLAEQDRKDILTAPNSASRLEAVLQVKERAWRNGLTMKQRERLKNVAEDEERQRLFQAWKATEKHRRDEWRLARQQRETPLGPFEDPANPKKLNVAFVKEVEQFIKQTLFVESVMMTDAKWELPASCRLSREEIYDLRIRYESATKDGEWFNFGLIVHRLAERHPYLPEHGKKPPIVDGAMLVKEFSKEMKGKGLLNQLERLEKRPSSGRGKWPDFALEVAEIVKKSPMATSLEWLGPCRPGQFNDTVNQFVNNELLPKLSDKEREALKTLEGRWPEYPRQLIQLAKIKDVTMPGVMLPGKPSLWSKFYSIGLPK